MLDKPPVFEEVLFQPIPQAQPVWGYGSVPYDIDQFIAGHDNILDAQLVEDHMALDWLNDLHERAQSADIDDIETEIPHLIDRYVAMSMMQKGVRRSEWKWTYLAILALFNHGKGQDALRRLKVICGEDVGNGDPEAASLAFLIMESKAAKMKFGPLGQALMAGKVLTAAWKSRDLCDLSMFHIVTPGVGTQVRQFRDQLKAGEIALDHLISAAVDASLSFQMRMAAFIPLWNLKEFGPKIADRQHRLAVYAGCGCSPSMIFMSEVSQRTVGASFGIGLPFVAQMARTPKPGKDAWLDKPYQTDFRGVPLFVYDRHTSAGKRALMGWSKTGKMKEWFEAHPQVKREDTIMRAAFYQEAAVLAPRMVYERSFDLYWHILDLKMRSTGVPGGLGGEGWTFMKLARETWFIFDKYRTS